MSHPTWLRKPLVAAVLLALAGAGAGAATVPAFDTGVDASGTKLAPGSTDPHWQLVAGPGVTSPTQAVVVTNQHPVGQYYSTSDSAWIWGTASGAAVGEERPTRSELQIDLTGLDASGTATLSGSWGADNFGDILFNGAAPIGTGTFALTGSPLTNFDEGHAFTITGGFVAGINTLDVQVVDTGNPGGLDVFGLSASAGGAVGTVPEPGMSALMLLGGLVLVGRARRRGKTPD